MNQDLLRNFFNRRHPDYARSLVHWLFLQKTYEGGRAWFDENIFRYHKEGNKEFKARVGRAYRFNHTREAVDLVQKYLFKGQITRDTDNASEAIKEFWKNTTLQNFRIDQLMRSAGASSSVKGRVAIVVDTNARQGAISVAEAKKSKRKIYAYLVDAIDLLDYAYDEEGDGGLLWVKVREYFRNDADPINGTGEVTTRVRLWTRTDWTLYEEQEEANADIRNRKEIATKIVELGTGTHDLGRVPIVFLDHIITDNPYRTPGLIDDIAYLDRAAANYLSNLDAIIQDQTFSQLTIPAQNLMPGEDGYDKIVEMGTKRIFTYDAGLGSGKPEFISPDPKQANVILTVINKIINEIYHTIGLAGERTKEDNAVGIDNSSGVAKAYDFERVNSLLTSKGQSCEKVENELVELVCLWTGEDAPKEKLVKYPETYDVMRLMDDLAVAEQLATIQAPAEVRREQLRILVNKLFPRLKADIKAKIEKDINKWLEGVDLLAVPATFGTKSPAAPSRQGQVTKDSPKKQGATAQK
ncbi:MULTISPECIES: phage portal protein [unclassified Ensifer]|uniref:phage portal protein n=1 Tax=unclassified Ensifer TaxID=2633371 RepID=UPI0008135A18|nr:MULTISPECIES: phage portal protein [unclassified Ensifer]OCP21909.1 hypothetical protein BC361_25405 [Ensifer sp. LC54]OCP23311.1 hypothetical protein BC363_25360 [Ensifer sp. LC384]